MAQLKAKVQKFCEERDWDQFHSIKDLAIALSIESSELLELFRWLTLEEQNKMLSSPLQKEIIEDELSDVFFFVLRISQKFDIDLEKALSKKIQKNAEKYPIEKSKGVATKYNQL